MSPRPAPDRRRRRYAEDTALAELERIRAPLFRELEVLQGSTSASAREPAHLCCTRRYNRMRISPLEAKAIAHAFDRDPELRARLPGVLERLERELGRVEDNEERQFFDCPLLEKRLCLVHDVAKPIGCLAWHPQSTGVDPEAPEFTSRGWRAFEQRDRLNDRFVGKGWKLRVIPLWLGRVFARQLDRRARHPESGHGVRGVRSWQGARAPGSVGAGSVDVGAERTEHARPARRPGTRAGGSGGFDSPRRSPRRGRRRDAR